MAALAEHGDPVAELHRLVEIVGDENDRLADFTLQAQELALQPVAGDRVDRTERLVHQQHRGIGGQRPRHPDPLTLSAGQLRRIPRAVDGRVEPDQLEQFGDPAPDAGLVPAQQAGNGRHVRIDRLVRKEPDLLDDVADAPPQGHRIDRRDVLAVQVDAAGRRLDQSVDHLHGGRLAAAGRPHERDELARLDVQAELRDGRGAVGVALGDAVQPDHRPSAPGRRRPGGNVRGAQLVVHAVIFRDRPGRS